MPVFYKSYWIDFLTHLEVKSSIDFLQVAGQIETSSIMTIWIE